MKTFLEFLTALAVLAIIQNLTIALGIVLLIVAVMAATIYPRQAFAAALLAGTLALAIERPVWCAAGLGAIGVATIITKRLRRQREPQTRPPLLLLPGPSRPH